MHCDEPENERSAACRPGSDRLRRDLRPLILEAAETASVYRYLLGLYPARFRDQVQSLYDGEMETIACLKGLMLLCADQPEKIRFPRSREGTLRALLELCYHRTRQAEEAYGARVVHPKHGTVFGILEAWARQRCGILAGLLGKL